MRISPGRILVLPLLATLAGGCVATPETCARTLERYLDATGFVTLRGKAEPAADSMAGRILAARRKAGWEAGFRVLGRDLEVMVRVLETAGKLPEEWRAQLREVGEKIRLPEPDREALGVAVQAGGEEERGRFEVLPCTGHAPRSWSPCLPVGRNLSSSSTSAMDTSRRSSL